MPVQGRSAVRHTALLVCAVMAALGAAPAMSAGKHRRSKLIVSKSHKRGHVPALAARRAPLRGTGLAAGPLSPLVPPAVTAPPPVLTVPLPACPSAIGVSEGEYYTRLSRSSACAGAIVVELRNTGSDDHDMTMLNTDTAQIAAKWSIAHPGDAAMQRLTLPAGRYRLFCTLSDGNGAHDGLGMNATLTIG
jgi:hypothetical protein